MRRRRRNYKKKSTGIVRFSKPVSGFPERIYTKLRYVATVTLGNGTFTWGAHTFRCNSVYDPDFTSGGHQPLYYDQYAAIYNYYTVRKCRMQIDVTNLIGGTTLNSVMAGVDILGSDTTSDVDINLMRERPGSTYKIVTTQYPRGRMVKWWVPKKFSPYSPADRSAAVGSNPTANDFFRVYAMSLDNTTALQSNQVSFTVTIDYFTEFFELTDVAAS